MTPEFAKAVDPVFLQVLGLLERIGRPDPNAPLDPGQQRRRIGDALHAADNKLGLTREWELAKYALCGWADALLIETEWEGNEWWNNNKLEFEFFNRADAYEVFYERAHEAAKLPNKDALEVFYICVCLGFRGLLGSGDPSVANIVAAEKLPADLATWARDTASAIVVGRGRPPLDDATDPPPGAPPLDGRFTLIGAVFLAALLCGAFVLVGWWLKLFSGFSWGR